MYDDDEQPTSSEYRSERESPWEAQRRWEQSQRDQANQEATSRFAWRVVFWVLPLLCFMAGAYFLVGTGMSQLSSIRDHLSTVYPDDWLFSLENDGGAVAVNYLVTIGVTTLLLVGAAVAARYLYLRSFVLTFWARPVAFLISAVGVAVLLTGSVLLLGAAQIANRTFPDQPGRFINTAQGQEWWPWFVVGLGIVLVAWRSSGRSVSRHRRAAVRRGDAEYIG